MTTNALRGVRSVCRLGQCEMGQVVVRALLHALERERGSLSPGRHRFGGREGREGGRERGPLDESLMAPDEVDADDREITITSSSRRYLSLPPSLSPPNITVTSYLSLLNSGALRASLSPGNFSSSDIDAAYPFADVITAGVVTGGHVLSMIRHGLYK